MSRNLQKFQSNIDSVSLLKTPKGVMFDWDNTLVDSWPLIQMAIDNTMIKMNREPWGLEKVRDEVHKSMRESFPVIFGKDWEEAGEIYTECYRANHLQKMLLLPNAKEFIEVLASKNILQFVVSNKMGNSLRKEVKNMQLDHLFFAIIGACDAIADKPSKHPAELALLGCDLDPKQDIIWFIGDTIADIECAVNAGCQPILYCDNIDKISKTIPEKMLTSDDFMGEFFNCRTNDYFLKKLPIIIGYNQLIKTTSLL